MLKITKDSVRIPGSLCLLAAIVCTACCGDSSSGKLSGVELTEASGICRAGDQLLIAGDDAHGRCFVYDLAPDQPPVIPLGSDQLREVKLEGAELAMDLEAIDVLADGRVALISEQLRCLISTDTRTTLRYKVIAEYDKSVTEIGNRGLEGLAVKPDHKDASLVAVVWEGGYPLYSYLPERLREQISKTALEPVVIVHRIFLNQNAGYIRDPFYKFELNTPKDTLLAPAAQRFRASDLVWHDWESDSGTVEGLIVVLQSENAPDPASGLQPLYKEKLLLRYGLNGQPYGEPVSINELVQTVINSLVPEDLQHYSEEMRDHLQEVLRLLDEGNWENVNWEGLSWYEPGESLILVYDTFPKEPPIAFVIPIPEEWK